MCVHIVASRSVVLLFLAALTSCGGCSLANLVGAQRSVTLLAYNVENLFDDVHNGTEYREFDPAAGDWNSELFQIKMQHIAEVLRTAVRGGADIVTLEEVENLNAAQALNETYLKGLGYRAFAGEGGRTAVTVVLLTRLPVTELRMHHLVTLDNDPLRDVMEAHIDCHGSPLVLFVNHWKSKLGGAESTEADRRAAAGLVARRIRAIAAAQPDAAIVVAGDLNENWDEYTRTRGAYPTALMPDTLPPGSAEGDRSLFLTPDASAARLSPERVVLYSPWADSERAGSYYYDNAWESIDNTFVGPKLFDGRGLEYQSFSVVCPAFLVDDSGRPVPWESRRASGYSDHLPILITLASRG